MHARKSVSSGSGVGAHTLHERNFEVSGHGKLEKKRLTAALRVDYELLR